MDGRRNCRAEWSDSGRLCQLMEHSRLLAAEGDEAKSPEECSLAGNGEQFLDPAFTSPFDAALDELGSDATVLEIGMNGEAAHLSKPL